MTAHPHAMTARQWLRLAEAERNAAQVARFAGNEDSVLRHLLKARAAELMAETAGPSDDAACLGATADPLVLGG